MISLIMRDARARPDLFQWRGPISCESIQKWACDHGMKLPVDLEQFWTETGGGDLFESEMMLAPLGGPDDENVDIVNRELRRSGMPEDFLVFHMGLCTSAVRLSDGKYLQLSEMDFLPQKAFSSLEEWYLRTLRDEYGARYGLPPTWADAEGHPEGAMMFERKARIRWLKPEEGGRSSPPPGPDYSTVARFEVLAHRWPQEAWSIVLHITAPADAEGVMVAGIRMLAEDDAPKELLSPGSQFELFEGRERVANGEVL